MIFPMPVWVGDGVYVELDRGMVKLTTSNGISDTNTIFLEPEVIAHTRHASIAGGAFLRT